MSQDRNAKRVEAYTHIVCRDEIAGDSKGKRWCLGEWSGKGQEECSARVLRG